MHTKYISLIKNCLILHATQESNLTSNSVNSHILYYLLSPLKPLLPGKKPQALFWTITTVYT